MQQSTIGDDFTPLYRFEWDDGSTRTSDELGDFDEAGLEASVDDVVDEARADESCEVTLLGFEEGE
jgi:hypothetical protein